MLPRMIRPDPVGQTFSSLLQTWLNSNKGTKSDIEIAAAERALDRFSSCFFEPVVQIGSGRAVATANKLVAGAVSQRALDLRTIEALLQVITNGPDHPWQHASTTYGI